MTQRKTAKKATKPLSKSSEPKPKKPKGGKREGAGRPKGSFKLNADERTLQALDGLGKIQATTKEAAAVLGVSEPTFIDFLKRDEKAQETFENGKGSGKVSLRRAQFKTALGGNATMQVWLGKQHLDQKDKSEIDNRVRFSFDEMSAEELREYVGREAAELGLGYAAAKVPRGTGVTRPAGRLN